MATATKTSKSSKTSKTAPKSAPTAPDNVTITPPAPTAPTLQDAVSNGTPLDGTKRVETINPSADPNTLEFMAVCKRLDDTIRSQGKRMVGYYSERGAIVMDGINVKVAKAKSKDDRNKLRAAALDAMEATAKGAFDPASEPSPNLGRWLYLGWLVRLFPGAAQIEKVGVAETIASGILTRVDPPASWDAPETWELRRGLDSGAVATFIKRVIAESMTQEQAKFMLDTLWGASEEAKAPTAKTDDPVKAARSLAESIMDKIKERKVDPETLFDELQSQLTRYGWALVKGRNGNGAETLKPVKTAR